MGSLDLSTSFVGKKATRALERLVWAAGFHVTRKVNTLRSKRMEVIGRCGVKLVLDVGANTGQWAAEIRRDGFTGRVLSFEPHSEAYVELERAAKRWGSQHMCFNVALGAENRAAPFFATKGSVNSSCLKPLSQTVKLNESATLVDRREIEVRRLDAVIGELGLADEPLYLKIDTQGYEREVLLGASETLNRTVAVEIELGLTEMYNGQALLPEVWRMLVAAGFRPAWIERGFRDPSDIWLMQVDGLFVREAAWPRAGK